MAGGAAGFSNIAQAADTLEAVMVLARLRNSDGGVAIPNLARSAENFDADSKAEVAGETDMEVDIEKGERCNCIFRQKHCRASAFHFTYIHMRQGALSFDCDQAVSGAASCPPAAQRHSPRVPHPECRSQSATPSDSDCDTCGFHRGLRADGEELRG